MWLLEGGHTVKKGFTFVNWALRVPAQTWFYLLWWNYGRNLRNTYSAVSTQFFYLLEGGGWLICSCLGFIFLHKRFHSKLHIEVSWVNIYCITEIDMYRSKELQLHMYNYSYIHEVYKILPFSPWIHYDGLNNLLYVIFHLFSSRLRNAMEKMWKHVHHKVTVRSIIPYQVVPIKQNSCPVIP